MTIINPEKELLIDLEIRRELGQRMLEKTIEGLPISLERESAVYTGELTLRKYMEFFPEDSGYKLAYLSLIQLNKKGVFQGMIKILDIYNSEEKKVEKAISEQDYEQAVQMRNNMKDALISAVKTLVEKLE